MLQPRKDKKIGKRANGDSYDQVYIKDGKRGMVNPAIGNFNEFMKKSIQNPSDNTMSTGYNPRNAEAYIKNVKLSNPNFKVQPVNLPREDQADVSKSAGLSRSTVLGRLPGNKKEKTINIFNSPAEGNAFTGAMAKTGGDYDKAKALLGDSPMDYGTGSPFQLRKEKLSGAERRNQKEGIDTSTPENKKKFQEYKASGGKLTTTQAARIGYATPKQSRSRKSTYAQDYGRGNNS